MASPRSPLGFLGLLLVLLAACFCSGAPTPAETRLSLLANTMTDEQLLAGMALVGELLPSGLDPLDVVYAIKNGTELALTFSQVEEYRGIHGGSQLARRDITECEQKTITVIADAVGVLASLFGVSMRIGYVPNSISLLPTEAANLQGVIQTIASSGASTKDRVVAIYGLLKATYNMFGIKEIAKWIVHDLSAWQGIKLTVTIIAQLVIWFGTDGLAFVAEVANLGVSLGSLVADSVTATKVCGAIPTPTPALPPALRLAVAQNNDGDWTAMEVFLLDQDSVPLHRYQNTDLSWSDWLNLGSGVSLTRLSVGLNTNGLLEAFGLGTNNEVYHIRQGSDGEGGWNPWSSFGGWSSEIATGANADGRLELVAAGSNNRAYHIWEDSLSSTSWSGWYTLSGDHPMKEFSVAVRPDGNMQVFALDTNQALYYVRQDPNGDGGWQSWQGLGGWSSSMVSSINADGRLEVFAVGSDNNVFHIWENAPNSNSWSQWSTFFTFKAKQLTATNLADGNIIVFALGMDNAIYYIYEGNNGWTSWTSLGGSASTISSITTKDGIVQVYALFSGDKNIYLLQQLAPTDPTSWTAWVPLN